MFACKTVTPAAETPAAETSTAETSAAETPAVEPMQEETPEYPMFPRQFFMYHDAVLGHTHRCCSRPRRASVVIGTSPGHYLYYARSYPDRQPSLCLFAGLREDDPLLGSTHLRTFRSATRILLDRFIPPEKLTTKRRRRKTMKRKGHQLKITEPRRRLFHYSWRSYVWHFDFEDPTTGNTEYFRWRWIGLNKYDIGPGRSMILTRVSDGESVAVYTNMCSMKDWKTKKRTVPEARFAFMPEAVGLGEEFELMVVMSMLSIKADLYGRQ